jgi:hypothetical protein
MMLRASTDAQLQNPDSEAIAVDRVNTRSAMLEQFVTAVVGADPAAAEAARADLVDQLGAEWLIDASAVVANFEMMTRLADATGARLRPEQLVASKPMRAELGLDAFPSART